MSDDRLKEWDIPRLAFEYRQAGRLMFDKEQLALSSDIHAELERRQEELNTMRTALEAVAKAMSYRNASADPASPEYVNPLTVAADRAIAERLVLEALAGHAS